MISISFYKFIKKVVFILIILNCIATIAQTEKNALKKIKELRLSSDFNPQTAPYIDALIDLADKYIHTKPDSSLVLIEESLELSLKSNYLKGECGSLIVYAQYYNERGQKQKAQEYNNRALELANSNNFYKEKINVLNKIGLNFWYEGNNAKALTSYLDALSIAEKTENTYMMYVLNNNIAILYSINKDYDTALSFYEKAVEIIKKYKVEKSVGGAYLNMAIIYTQKKDFVTAGELADKCVEIFEKENRLNWLSNAYQVQGYIANARENYKKGLQWYTKSEKLCNQLNYQIGIPKTFYGLARSYQGLGNLKSAEKLALKTLKTATKNELVEEIESANLILSEIYHELGLNDKAYTHQTAYIKLYKQTSGENYKKGLGILRSKMEFENQKKALIEENNRALAKQKTYVYITLATLFIVILFLLLIFRTHRLQKRFTAKLKDSNRTKDKLFSVIAHDLQGPINSFYSLMKLYMDKEFSKEESAYLFPKAMADIQNISDMLNNLLLWAKTQMQGTTIKQQNIDINALVKDNIELLNPLAEKKSIKITTTIPENTLSYSDRDHMDIVLRNLISNAIKFTNRNGEIHINSFEKDDELQIEVSDNGVGMDLETQSKLFEKNNTESTYGTNNEKGTGLGLSLCRDMVESSGGKIGVSSIKDKGTTIYFTLPIKQGYLKAI